MSAERSQGSGQEKESLLRSRVIQGGVALMAAGIIFKELAALAVVGLGLVGGKLLHRSWKNKK